MHVLLTMRSDFIGECARFHSSEAVSASQFLVPSLTREQLEEVIRTPIERAGATIEGALVQRLLNDSGSDLDQLPVLQHCLSRLWERAEKDIAPQDATASVTMTDDPGPKPGGSLSSTTPISAECRRRSCDTPTKFSNRLAPSTWSKRSFGPLSEVDNSGAPSGVRSLSLKSSPRRANPSKPCAPSSTVFGQTIVLSSGHQSSASRGTQARYSDRRGPRGVAAAVEARQRESGRRTPRNTAGAAYGSGSRTPPVEILRFLLRKPSRDGEETPIAQPSASSLGWLQLEEERW